jgi:hypothetical protein
MRQRTNILQIVFHKTQAPRLAARINHKIFIKKKKKKQAARDWNRISYAAQQHAAEAAFSLHTKWN